MTKKDYELIAGAFQRTTRVVHWFDKNKVKRQAKLEALGLLANDLAGTFYGENKKFDRNKFLEACGIED